MFSRSRLPQRLSLLLVLLMSVVLTMPPAPAAAQAAGATAWYFAEGFTGTGFDQYFTIQNPNATPAQVQITYYLSDGTTQVKQLTVNATTRATVSVHDTALGVGRGREVSAKVETTNGVGIVVERPMYFTYGTNIRGGHNVLGTTALRQDWYFAEGHTGVGFDEYLTILNPNTTEAPVTITYYLSTGTTEVVNLTVPPTSRYTVAVHSDDQGVGRGQDVSAKVSTTNAGGIVVERPMYFTYKNTITDGHNVMGADTPRTAWYFAEGHTGTGFDQYLTIQNPNNSAANITITYYLATGGTPVVKPITVPANSRYTVSVHDTAEGVGRGQDVSAKVTSDVGIVVERPMYFTYGTNIDGGHNVVGAAEPRTAWFFAEGSTAAGFDEYLTIQNPNSTAAGVTITYYLATGATQQKAFSVPANSRYTVAVYGTTEGVGRGQEVSAEVTTTNAGGIVVERPMYFTYGTNLRGGHNELGYPDTAATTPGYANIVLGDDPLSYWRLDEAAGSTAEDSAGTVDGTYTGTPTLGQEGAVAGNTSVLFNEPGDDYVNLPDVYDFVGQAPFTLEAWVYPIDEGTSNPDAFRRIISKEAAAGAPTWLGYNLSYSQADGFFCGRFDGMGVTSQTWVSSARLSRQGAVQVPSPVALNTWHYVVCTYDGATLRLYVNGTEVGSALDPDAVGDHAEPLRIGQLSTGGSFVEGRIDEVAIYDRALSATEILEHFNAAS